MSDKMSLKTGYDPKVPVSLKRTQQWFGSIIGRPIDDDSRMNPLSPSGQFMEIEAADYIVPSPTLRPAQRIQLYNQQYWWRLLNTLQESFPLVTRLFGFYEFNRTIAIPYLVKYPPKHWSLSLLGDRLGQFAREDYKAEDKPLVIDSILLDWAFNFCFIAPERAPISQEKLVQGTESSTFIKKKLYTQPHLHLFCFDSNMFQFRSDFLQQPPEYWIDHDFPELKRDQSKFYCLFRTQNNDISWKEISHAEYTLLQLFANGSTIEKACGWIERQDDSVRQEASEKLHLWFQEWTYRRWLTFKNH